MKTLHKLNVVGRCPVDGAHDIYEVVIETDDGVLPVEDIHTQVFLLTREPIYQENLTRRLSEVLGARVTTVGRHSGIETTCEVTP